MDYIQKIKLQNELMLNATPQNVDFTPQNGNYCVALIATRPVHTWGYQKRNFKIKGRLEEGKTVLSLGHFSKNIKIKNNSRQKEIILEIKGKIVASGG